MARTNILVFCPALYGRDAYGRHNFVEHASMADALDTIAGLIRQRLPFSVECEDEPIEDIGQDRDA